MGTTSGGDPAESPVLLIPENLLAAMVDHCQREAPLECCGILGGIPPRVSSIHLLRNTDASETRYNADPADILAALRFLRARGEQFLAIYHSHPKWAAIPSRTDLEANYYGELPRIIVSLLEPSPDVRAWRLDPNSYAELPWIAVPADTTADVEPPASGS